MLHSNKLTSPLDDLLHPTAEQIQTSIPWHVRLSWLEDAHSRPLFSAVDFDPQSRLDRPSFVCDQGSLVGLCVQDYKSLCAAAMICATLINIQTHTHTDSDTQTKNISTGLIT